ncbi:MAG: SH3 domain-containing protein [Candidatus Eisenbacteria bacterium]|nr:SH3 domain-containing protein [Candidatus Eisenbacteria bacterium]
MRRLNRGIVPPLIGILLAGCGGPPSKPPRGWLPSAKEGERSVCGGWVDIRLREPLPRESWPEPWDGEVTVSFANLHDGPRAGFGSDVVGAVKRGDCYRLIEEKEFWLRIRLDDGAEGWVSRQYVSRKPLSPRSLRGELIAVEEDSLFLLQRGRLIGVPLENVRDGVLRRFDSSVDHIKMWTALGAVSTVTHSFLLIFSLPLWLVVGLPTSHGIGRLGRVRFDREKTDRIAPGARFPGGFPEGIDRDAILPGEGRGPCSEDRGRGSLPMRKERGGESAEDADPLGAAGGAH